MTRIVLIGFGVVLLAVSSLSYPDLHNQRPRLPVLLGGEQELVVQGANPKFPEIAHGLVAGDRLLEIDGRGVPDGAAAGFLLDGKRVGDRVELVVERDGQSVLASAVLSPSLDSPLLVINFVVAFFIWAFAMLVVYRGAMAQGASVFYWMSMGLSTVMLIHWPENSLVFGAGGWVSPILEHGFYPLTVGLLLHFALIYPEGWRRRWLRGLNLVSYVVVIGIAITLIWLLRAARSTLDIEAVQTYLFARDRALPFFIVVMFLGSLAFMAANFLRSKGGASRQKLKWLFWGLAVGVSPFLLLHELPESLGATALIPEHIGYLFILLAPLAFFVSVVRHQLLDVNLVIRRSLVYSLLTVFVVGVYLALVGLGDWLAVSWWGTSSSWIRVGIVLMLAIAFEPARNLAQGLIERTIYRSQRDQRIALMEYSRETAHTLDVYRLTGRLHKLLSGTLPVERLLVFVAEEGSLTEVQPGDTGQEQPAPLKLAIADIPGLSGSSESGAFEPSSMPEELEGMHLIVPLLVEQRLAGLIALEVAKDEDSFRGDDHRFVRAVASQTALAFDRARAFKANQDLNISLEQKIWVRTQQLAKANDRLAEQYEQLVQLNEMKEALSRMVVHDLKNPVSTILLGLEFLDRSQLEGLPENVSSTLNIISSTALEIQDLVANLLDVYRMEAGELILATGEVDVRDLLDEGAKRVEILSKYRNVKIELQVAEGLHARVDRDLMIRVVVNLLTNAVKHSGRNGTIELSAEQQASDGHGEALMLSVTNGGAVIPTELHEKVFEKFFQVEGKRSGVIAGTGLGLAFCKLVVEAHGGRIMVQSPAPGRVDGARFSMKLPETPAQTVVGASNPDSEVDGSSEGTGTVSGDGGAGPPPSA